MAAGLGTRMKSRTPKLLHPLAGRPMVAYVVDAGREVTGRRPLVVTSPATAAVRDALGDDADYALQAEPRGTGDAVAAAVAALPDDADEILVLTGDAPLLEASLLAELLEERRLDQAAIALVAVDAIDPGNLGRVIRDEAGTVERIVEKKDATDEEIGVNEINSGLYAFDAGWLRSRIGSLSRSPKTGELYLTELVELARADGRLVVALTVEDDGRLLGINDRSELAQAEWDLRTRINGEHMRAGVTMRDPSTVYADSTVTLAADVILEPNVILRGTTSIGEGTTIGAGSQIVDSTIGSGCVVWASVVESSVVEDGARVGPFSHLRPGSHVGPDAEVGNFAELKNTRLGRGREAAPHELPGRRRARRGDERGGRHDHCELRRPPQAPDHDRQAGLPRRRHDAPGPADDRRRCEDRRRGGRHARRAARQARGRDAGADARPEAGRASTGRRPTAR